jgi:hypothetical protein
MNTPCQSSDTSSRWLVGVESRRTEWFTASNAWVYQVRVAGAGKTQVRRVILGDVYKPHTFEEIRGLVTPEVDARLNPEKNYGIWWFNRRRVKVTQVSEPSDTGKRYRRRSELETKDQSE